MIAINRLSLDFQADTYAFARDLYKEWDAFCRHSVEKVIDDVLSPFDREDEVIEIECLEVPVGVLTEEDFHDSFPVQFARSLYEQFTAFLHQAVGSSAVGVRITPVLTRHAELLLFFLSNGYLPSMFANEAHTPSALLAAVVGSKDPGWVSSLRREWHRMSLRERLVMQFADEELQRIVAACEVENAAFIQSFTHHTIHCQPRSSYAYIPQSSYRTVVWILVLTYLMKEGDGFFNHKQFILYTVRELAAHYNLDYLDILRALFAYTSAVVPADTRTNKLAVLLEEIDRTEHYLVAAKGAAADGSLQPLLPAGKSSSLIGKEQQIKRSSVADRSFPGRDRQFAEIPVNAATESEGLTGRIDVPNAGLVLLAPWLPRLFERLNLMEDKCFTDDASTVKALFTLQQLVYDEWDAFAEHELVLNRLLTGYTDTGKPLPRAVELTDADRASCQSLLESVRQNWPTMQNTSIRAFREAFLQRNGLLEQKENHWVLKIETRAYDVLLDTIPWTYTSVKYPWMEMPVHVQWR